jgi:hypothetical protein
MPCVVWYDTRVVVTILDPEQEMRIVRRLHHGNDSFGH